MHTHVLLSFDLKQNTSNDARKLFDEALERCGWKDCPEVGSTKTKVFTVGGLTAEAKSGAYMEVYEATLSASIKEISYVIHCGDSEPLQRTFLHPKLNKMLASESYPIPR